MKKKVQVAFIAKDMIVNGISNVIMNYCRNIDRNKIQITIFAGEPVVEIYEKECNELGIKIEKMPPKRGGNPFKYYTYLLKKINKKNFDIIHVHGNSATITIEMLIAKIKGIKVRIAHCHNTTCDNKKVHKILQPLFRRIYTHGFACSEDAGKWMFNKSKFEVLPNGFITEKFIFDEKKRKEVRKKLNIDDKYVIGHVGMFLEQKNHEFILQVFEEVAKTKEDSVLLLIGTGPDYDKIQKIIEKHSYKDRIICYGVTNNVSELYDAMDLFFFPSKHEGLGIVLLEAQIKGLKCVTSDVVPREVVLDDNNIKFISLDDDIAVWKNELISNDIKGARKDFYKKQIEKINRFNIIENAKDLGDKYILYCKKK